MDGDGAGPPPPPPPPDHVPERGGPWVAEELDPAAHLALQTQMPLTVIYKVGEGGEREPHLLVAESALLRRARAPSGLGIYALRRFKGPRELGARRVEGDEIGWYGGRVVATAPTQRQADAASQALVAQNARYLLTMRLQGHPGSWLVVDGNQQPVLPFLHRANDPRGTPLLPKCVVSDFGRFRAARDIPALDWTRPLRSQLASELSWEYGEDYWEVHDATEGVGATLALELGALRLVADVGCGGESRRRSTRSSEASGPSTSTTTTPDLAAVETDAEGRVVYADLRAAGRGERFAALLASLRASRPTERVLERLTPINRGRLLVEVVDEASLACFGAWLRESTTGSATLQELLAPLGTRLRLLGGQWIVPKATEYAPRILPQAPHTDVDAKGEVVSVAINVDGHAMGTLVDARARLDEGGRVLDGSGFGRADTALFAYDTGAVHAGPGVPCVVGPYPRYFTERVFFLLSSDGLEPDRIAKHRSDNGLRGAADLVIELM